MGQAILVAFIGLIGVALGGGLQALQSGLARRAEAASVLSALVAEVDALTRLINHRRFLRSLVDEANACKQLIDHGRGEEPVAGISMSMSHDYLAIFNALGGKIGLIEPYKADRIVRFYALAKAATESLLDPGIIAPMPAIKRLELLESDMQLVQVLLIIGQEVAAFRVADGPASVLGPLQADQPSYEYRTVSQDQMDALPKTPEVDPSSP